MINKELKILQCNLNKSRETTDSILNSDTAQFDILALQEQHYAPLLKSSLLHQSWTLIESTQPELSPSRSAFYINNKLLPTSAFHQLHLPINDVTAIEIIPEISQNKSTLLMNIYNPSDNPIITPLRQYLQRHLHAQDYDKILILGDFNLHHPTWNPTAYTKHDTLSDELLELMEDHDLQLLLPPGTITYPCNTAAGGTTIDLVWGNEKAEECMLKCQISADNDHGSDHLPIETILDLSTPPLPPIEPAYNYEKTNWKLLKSKQGISSRTHRPRLHHHDTT